MLADRRAALVERFIEDHCKAVMSSKGSSYSRGEDNVNSNFYRNAEGLGTHPAVPAWLFALKHIDAVTDYIKRMARAYADGTDMPGQHIGDETVESRLGDIVNYCFILYSILVDEGVLRDPDRLEWHEVKPVETDASSTGYWPFSEPKGGREIRLPF